MLTYFFFFFNDTATTEIYTLSLHDALPISVFDRTALVESLEQVGLVLEAWHDGPAPPERGAAINFITGPRDRKSTRLNSSHGYISYAVFCLKKKKSHLMMRMWRYLTRVSIS